MPEPFIPDKDLTGKPQELLHNTGYNRSYYKTDKISSNFFETGSSAPGNNTILQVALKVPKDVNDIEAWLEVMVLQQGYHSWNEIEPFLNLPAEAAVILDHPEQKARVSSKDPFETLRKAVILSRCGKGGYDPGSPMIFSKKRINRAVTLVTINIKSFYELD